MRSSKSRSISSSKRGWQRLRHPVDLYARRVAGDFTAGRPIIAGPFVRQACERHLRDRQTGAGRGLHFDADTADHALAFFPRFLRHAEGVFAGKPFVLAPWQIFIVGSLFGWLGTDGARRFRTAYIEAGKGNGKTPLAAGIGLYGLLADGEAAAEIYSAATTLKQAKILYGDAEKMVDASPQLRRRIARHVNNLSVLGTYSFFRPVSSEHRALDGPRPHIALIDEIHEHANALVVDKIRAGTKGRRQALIVMITNSGFDRTTVCWYLHEYSEKILAGTARNEAWFCYVCSLDEGDDPLRTPAIWPKANPNLGVSIKPKYLREQVREARGMSSKVNIVLRLNFCVWTQASHRAISPQEWAANGAAVSELQLAGKPCYGGLDLGQTDDFSAWVRLWDLLDGRYAVRARFWIPEVALLKYPTRPYGDWQRAGILTVTEGNTTDYTQIQNTVAADCHADGVLELAYDKRFAEQMAQNLQGDGINCTDQPQGWQLNEALGRFLELITDRRLCHGNDPILAWMAPNLVVRHGRGPEGDRIRPDKQRAPEKIDGIVALVMALARAIVAPPPAESAYADGHGVVTVGPY